MVKIPCVYLSWVVGLGNEGLLNSFLSISTGMGSVHSKADKIYNVKNKQINKYDISPASYSKWIFTHQAESPGKKPVRNLVLTTFIKTILHFPPPQKKKNCITIVSNFSRVIQLSQEKSKTMVMRPCHLVITTRILWCSRDGINRVSLKPWNYCKLPSVIWNHD